MAATGLEVFDKTIQTTNIWLDEIMSVLGPDRHLAWKVLSVVLRKLRDRIPIELAAHLGDELPLLVRGAYYGEFDPTKLPLKFDLDEFTAAVAERLSDVRPVNPTKAMWAAFAVLSRHVPEGQIRKVQAALPKDLRNFWVSTEQPEPSQSAA